MAHLQQLTFVSLVDQHFVKMHRPNLRILEVGSYDINGSVRSILAGCEHIGADLCEGPGVDLVCSGHEIYFPDSTFDISISCESFEHNPYWHDTFVNMHRMTKDGGLVIFTCASKGRIEHGTRRTKSESSPGTSAVGIDYYRNLNQSDFENSLSLPTHFSAYSFFYIPKGQDLYFIGWKSGNTIFKGDIDKFSAAVKKINKMGKFRIRVFDLPIALARRFEIDDRKFQNFCFGYLNAVRPIREFIKSLSR